MSTRRQTRLRSEYLYRQSLQGAAKVRYQHKRAIKEAIAAGKPIPTELASQSLELHNDLQHDDALTGSVAPATPGVDDEYEHTMRSDYVAHILMTTSRHPSSRLLQFVKELHLLVPNSQRVNRGNTVVGELMEACKASNITDLIIVHEHRGEPDGLILSHLPYGPTAYFGLRSVVLRHDLPDRPANMSQANPHLIFDLFQSKLGLRVQSMLSAIFPVPKLETPRVITFANRDDTISFRHHVYKKLSTNAQGIEAELAEVGPRFEMTLYQIKLGSLEMTEAENEWVLRPYMNTAKRRKAL